MIDFGALTTQLLATYWWLPPLLLLAGLFKSTWFKPKKESVPFNSALGRCPESWLAMQDHYD